MPADKEKFQKYLYFLGLKVITQKQFVYTWILGSSFDIVVIVPAMVRLPDV